MPTGQARATPGAAVVVCAQAWRRQGRSLGSLGSRSAARYLQPVAAWRRAWVGLGLACAAGLALAQGAGPAGHWLGRVQLASSVTSYQGTLMVSASGVVSSSRVLHVCDGRQRYERVESLDGKARVQLRHNDQLLTLWPTSKQARSESRDPVAEFPSLSVLAGPLALENYEPASLVRDRIAGHEADVLMLKPRDKLRYAQRLWADRETGLLLRNDVIGPGGEVLESSAFTEVQIGGRLSAEPVLGPMKRIDGYKLVRATSQRAQIEAEGWLLGRQVPGFQLVSCSKRPLADGDPAVAPVQVLQSVFSDGLAHVSVFIEPFDPVRHQQALGTSLGANHTVSSRQGDWWFTVVGEVPMATAQQFSGLFERRR